MYLRRNSPILRVKAEAALSKIVNFLHDHDGGWYLEDRNNYDFGIDSTKCTVIESM